MKAALERYKNALDEAARIRAAKDMIAVVLATLASLGLCPFLPGFGDWTHTQAEYDSAIDGMADLDLDNWVAAVDSWTQEGAG